MTDDDTVVKLTEETVDRWCQSQGAPRRPPVSLDQPWRLAVAWYANRLTIESRRPGPDEMVSVFASIGPTGPFWDPKSDAWKSST